MFSFFRRTGSSATDISHAELTAGLASGEVTVIDVREPQEFAHAHIDGAINLPLSRFDVSKVPTDRHVALICLSGARSAAALRSLQQAGFTNVRHYRAGMSGWQRACTSRT